MKLYEACLEYSAFMDHQMCCNFADYSNPSNFAFKELGLLNSRFSRVTVLFSVRLCQPQAIMVNDLRAKCYG